MHDKNLHLIENTRKFLSNDLNADKLSKFKNDLKTDVNFADSMVDEVIKDYGRIQTKNKLKAIDKKIALQKQHKLIRNLAVIPIILLLTYLAINWFSPTDKTIKDTLASVDETNINIDENKEFKKSITDIVDGKNEITKEKNNCSEAKAIKKADVKAEKNNETIDKTKCNKSTEYVINETVTKKTENIAFTFLDYNFKGKQIHCYLVKGKKNKTLKQILFRENQIKAIKNEIIRQENNKHFDEYTYIELHNLAKPVNYLIGGTYKQQELLQKVWTGNFASSKKFDETIKNQKLVGEIIEINNPENNSVIKKGQELLFDWSTSYNTKLCLTIFTNKNKEVFKEKISSNFNLSTILPEGQYYWQLSTENEILYTNRFFVVSVLF